MTPFARACTGEGHASTHFEAGLMQALDEIVRQERAVPRHTDNPFNSVLLLRQPIEARKYPGQRTGEVRYGVRHNREARVGKPFWIAIRADNDANALRG